MADVVFLTDPLLEAIGVAHGFGTRGATPPAGVLRPRQVHGVEVATPNDVGALAPAEADTVVCRRPGQPIAVVTADCVPILLASASGEWVAVVHAGWRGLAAGVIGEALQRLSEVCSERFWAAVGPHARACCYEVDAPVTEPLAARFEVAMDGALRSSRPGHHWLDLEHLVVDDLVRAGLRADRVGTAAAHCTVCDAARFESHRRDGAASGRLWHWIAARSTS